MRSVNIFSVEEHEGRIDVAQQLGSSSLMMFVYDLDPGTSSSPYHYEYEDEWLLVVEGTVAVRAPDGEHTLQRGDLLRFPAGPEGAHKVMNRSDSPARTLMFSSARVPSVSVYPDSDKIGVWSGNEPDELIFERGTAVDWSEGEDGWHLAS
ncbi:MAG TPA: cupin domain-containing protein [Gaiellaceae bacterium]|nr:cupin domain-containing protein [Gaiellaceae bacterium]